MDNKQKRTSKGKQPMRRRDTHSSTATTSSSASYPLATSLNSPSTSHALESHLRDATVADSAIVTEHDCSGNSKPWQHPPPATSAVRTKSSLPGHEARLSSQRVIQLGGHTPNDPAISHASPVTSSTEVVPTSSSSHTYGAVAIDGTSAASGYSSSQIGGRVLDVAYPNSVRLQAHIVEGPGQGSYDHVPVTPRVVNWSEDVTHVDSYRISEAVARWQMSSRRRILTRAVTLPVIASSSTDAHQSTPQGSSSVVNSRASCSCTNTPQPPTTAGIRKSITSFFKSTKKLLTFRQNRQSEGQERGRKHAAASADISMVPSSLNRQCQQQGLSGAVSVLGQHSAVCDVPTASDHPAIPRTAATGVQQPMPAAIVVQADVLGNQAIRAHTTVDYLHYLVPELRKITSCGFYWGIMDRYAAEELLDGKPEGTFLLRDSSQDDFIFSVSFRRYNRSLHARIEQWNHQFSFDAHESAAYKARTVNNLIERYKDPSTCMFFEPMLTRPLNRPTVFSLQHLARAVVCDHITYDSIDGLSIPRALQDYLRYYHYKQKVRVTSHHPITAHR